jgi:hypothetical protein
MIICVSREKIAHEIIRLRSVQTQGSTEPQTVNGSNFNTSRASNMNNNVPHSKNTFGLYGHNSVSGGSRSSRQGSLQRITERGNKNITTPLTDGYSSVSVSTGGLAGKRKNVSLASRKRSVQNSQVLMKEGLLLPPPNNRSKGTKS